MKSCEISHIAAILFKSSELSAVMIRSFRLSVDIFHHDHIDATFINTLSEVQIRFQRLKSLFFKDMLPSS